jgi:hypothetical protein
MTFENSMSTCQNSRPKIMVEDTSLLERYLSESYDAERPNTCSTWFFENVMKILLGPTWRETTSYLRSRFQLMSFSNLPKQ